MLKVPVTIEDPEFRALCEDYWQSIPSEIDHLGHYLDAIIDGCDDGRAFEEAYRLAHQISGSAGSYEMPQTTCEARRLEIVLKEITPEQIDESVRNLVRDAYSRLKSTMDILIAA